MNQLPKRLLSIDVLRAITMLLMIFVNDASGVKHIPMWIDHADGDADGMGFADTISPAFLFIVGLSLPFAIKNRMTKGNSFSSILIYILTRSAALIIMGFFHVNLESYNSAAGIIPKALWAILITIGFFLIWLDYPTTMTKIRRYTFTGAGILLLIVMAVIYKGGDNGESVHGMRTSWWGILGIIGWAYLVCALIYLLAKGKMNILVIALIVFVAINIAKHTDVINFKIPLLGDASAVSLVMGGVMISGIYSVLVSKNKTQLLWVIFGSIGLLLIALGLLVRPYAEGISKIHSTPAWIFICSGITILVFELMIFLIDVKGKKDWFKIIWPAGTSTLTCYLMPYFQVFILMLFHIKYPEILNNGIIGLVRSMATAFILIAIVGLMEKKRIRLKI
jgi:heparan-alpha-glucosaminide N-acetyltransferase